MFVRTMQFITTYVHAAACGMDAIGSDEHGRADIDYEKCVSCGQCLVNCPLAQLPIRARFSR